MEVLLDDRDARPGAMFADMELIGIPHRIVIGERGLDEGRLEYRGRTDSNNRMIEIERILPFLQEQLRPLN
jgi:prolyl-tRNA synthetase